MRLLLIFLSILSGIFGKYSAQNRVEWTAKYDWNSKEIIISAKIEKGWHLYSQHISNDVGPVPTAFDFKSQTEFKTIGKTSESEPIKKYDENFEASLTYFENSAEFRQKIKAEKGSTIFITITYMVCDNTMCLPPIDIEIPITLI